MSGRIGWGRLDGKGFPNQLRESEFHRHACIIGAVREYQLRVRLRFKVRNRQGIERIPDTEMVQQRDITFNDSDVLAKETEEALLYRDMQTDAVQQLMRRLQATRIEPEGKKG